MKEKIKLSIFWVTSFIIIIFMMSFSVHAASDQDYFPMFQNNNGNFTDVDITYIENYYNTTDNYVFAYFSGYAGGYGNRMKNFYVISIPKTHNEMIYGEKFNNLYQFSIYSVGNLAGNQFDFLQILDQGWYYHYSASISQFQNLQSSNYNTSVDYISNFQLMTNNTSTAQIVLFYDDGVTIPDGDTARDDMEKPDINDYIPSWNNKPSFDGSSVENALSSIWDITIWTAENTRDTIKGVGHFIGDTLRWTSQKIIDSIRGKIDELKTGITTSINNVSAFVQDIKGFVNSIFQKIDYITTPLEADIIWDNISGTSLITNYSSIMNAASSMKSSFENLSEPIDYKIPIHLEDLPSSWFGNLTTQYIDLGVINPVKSILRTFMWALITYSLFVTIIDSIANYINGGGDES